MKRTIVKVLTAALVLTTLVCTAAGCGNKGTAGSNSQAGTESTVSTAASENAQNSQIEIAESKPEADIRDTELDKITKDMIKAAYIGDDTTDQYTALVLMLDDGKPEELCVIYVIAKANGNPTAAGLMNGTVVESSEKDNDDGSRTRVFRVLEPRGMSDTMTQTTTADGKITMSFAGGPYVLDLAAIDSESAFVKYQEAYEIFKKYTAGNDRTQDETNAATLDALCKNYYAEIVSGSITAENNTNVKSDKLPSEKASMEEKKEAAQKCTVNGAMENYGVFNEEGECAFDLEGMRADGVGTIFYKDDETRKAALETITGDTTFEELGYGK